MELIRRIDGKDAFGLTTPLITTADGAKMGKTAKGAVWLNREQLSDYDYWQFWRNTQDADVGRFLRLFTDMPLSEIARLEALEGAEINAAKEVLANAATRLCRGESASASASATAHATFAGGSVGEDLPRMTADGPIMLVDALVGLGLATSKGEARRLIAGGGARINGAVASDETAMLPSAGDVRISAGKKRHGVVSVG
jgi:tyrosyl-tRNA synthetase